MRYNTEIWKKMELYFQFWGKNSQLKFYIIPEDETKVMAERHYMHTNFNVLYILFQEVIKVLFHRYEGNNEKRE